MKVLPGLSSIAFPYRIGCGLAGGEWTAYASLLQAFARDAPSVRVVLCRLEEEKEELQERWQPVGEVDAGFAEMDKEHQAWYDEQSKKREQLAEEARDEFGMGTWDWGASLRLQWAAAQRLDKDLQQSFLKTWSPPHDERISPTDGVLEKLAEQAHQSPKWVPVVPNGYATKHLTWKNGPFSSCIQGFLEYIGGRK